MTKQELSRYFWLCHEIEKQKKRLERLQAKRANSGGFVGDSVKDYRSGRGVPLKIQVYAEEDYTGLQQKSKYTYSQSMIQRCGRSCGAGFWTAWAGRR